MTLYAIFLCCLWTAAGDGLGWYCASADAGVTNRAAMATAAATIPADRRAGSVFIPLS